MRARDYDYIFAGFKFFCQRQGYGRFGKVSIFIYFDPEGTNTHFAVIQGACVGFKHDAEHWFSTFDQGDVDCKFAIALHKFLGAVQRIDHPKPGPRPTFFVGQMCTLFAQHRYCRRRKDRHNCLVRTAVGQRQWRCVRLVLQFYLCSRERIDLHNLATAKDGCAYG